MKRKNFLALEGTSQQMARQLSHLISHGRCIAIIEDKNGQYWLHDTSKKGWEKIENHNLLAQ